LGSGKGDYAAVVIEYAKALECHLHKRFFQTFEDSLREDGVLTNGAIYQCDFGPVPAPASEQRSVERSVNELRSFLAEDKPLTMGAMWHVALRLRHETKAAPVLGMLAAHLRGHDKGSQLMEADFVKEWGRFTEAFRNGAAHGRSMSLEQAKECRNLVFAGPKSLLIALI
jgi:hypothetical protein